MLLIIFLVTTVTLAVYLLWNQKRNYWNKRNIVAVKGTMTEVIFGKKPLSEIIKRIYEEHPNESYIGTFMGLKPTLIIKDLTDIQTVFAADFHNFNHRGIEFNENDKLADNVLMVTDAKRWRLLRHKLTPMFTSLKLKNMFYILDKCAQDFAQRIKESPQFVEKPYDAMLTYATSSITASVFGIDANIKNTMDNPLLHTAKKSIEFNWRSIFLQSIALISPRILSIFNLNIFGPFEEFFLGAFRMAVENRKQTGEKRHDLVDLCIELQKQGMMEDPVTGYKIDPTVDIVAAQGWFFFIAGTDTSANTMHFTLLELASNPDILKQVHEEIDKVFDECNENMTYAEMEKLQYLDMCYSEAMRKYPPIGHLIRQCIKTSKLPAGNLTVEKGCMVIVPVFAIHRDEKHYPNPDKFDPDRFSPENVALIPKYANLSFGEGNRICIGNRYARLQVKAGLAWLLRKFTLRPQNYHPKRFEPSFFQIKDSTANYELIPRK